MPSIPHRVYLLLGSNLGDRIAHLQTARTAIADQVGEIVQASRVYETEAWGLQSQGPFLNQALEVHTTLTPEEVLASTRQIEEVNGRTRNVQWGPRTLDIDIAFYDDCVIESEDLVVPHPHIPQRNFALVPLIEIAGHMMHPVLQETLRDLFSKTTDHSEVTILGGG